MMTFTIDTENIVTAYTKSSDLQESDAANLAVFDSQAGLAQLTGEWPMSRLVEIWNSIPGQIPVKKFQDRKKAVARIWNAIQSLAGGRASEASPTAIQPAKTTRNRKPAKKAALDQQRTPRKQGGKEQASERSNKKAEVIALMKRSKGVTLAEIMELTQWQAHTVRGFVSILGSKGGFTIESSKNPSGDRTYKIAK